MVIFGVKNNNFYKGIYLGPKGEDGGQSDWYGFLHPKEHIIKIFQTYL